MNEVDIETRIQQYVRLRDTIRDLDDQHKERMKPYREALEGLNTLLLQHLQDINSNSASSNAGTVYKSLKQNACIKDMEAFWEFVRHTQSFDLVDKRANVPAVADYIRENGVPPPGVSYSSAFVVGVRRK